MLFSRFKGIVWSLSKSLLSEAGSGEPGDAVVAFSDVDQEDDQREDYSLGCYHLLLGVPETWGEQ